MDATDFSRPRSRTVGLALFAALSLARGLSGCGESPACLDGDGDGYGEGCDLGPDCDDEDPDRHPDATERCDGVDQDCDGTIDDACVDPRDAGMDAATPPDGGSGVDGGADAGARDAGGDPDAGGDAATPDGGVDGGTFPLPSSCTDSSECGPDASCDESLGVCICSGGALPCGGGCCPSTILRDVEITTGGHEPELGGDAAGNIYVLYVVGDDRVTLSTIDPAGAVTTEAVATSSGESDAADLAVAPDGTLHVAVHQPGGGRSGTYTLYTRAPGGSTFTTMPLRTGTPEAFAYDAAVSIGRAAGGDIYAACSARSGDGTMGLAMTKYDAASGLWTGLPSILGYHGHSRSELFARDDGFYVGVHDLAYAERYVSFDADATYLDTIAIAIASIYDRGESAAAMSDTDVLYTFARGRLEATTAASPR